MSKASWLRAEMEDVIYAHGIGPLASSQIADDIVKNVITGKFLLITVKQADELIAKAENLFEGNTY